MSLKILVQRGIGLTLSGPFLATAMGHAAGSLITSAAGSAYETIKNHFTLTGNDLANAFQASWVRALGAIQAELGGSAVRNMLRQRLQRELQQRLRQEYLLPFAQAQGLSDTQLTELSQAVVATCASWSKAKQAIFPAREFSNIELAKLFSEASSENSSELLLAQVNTIETVPPNVREFLAYNNLLADALWHFLCETLRRDPRVEATLNAMQQAGIRQDISGLQEQLNQALQNLQAQQSRDMQAMQDATQAGDMVRMNTLMGGLNQLNQTLADYPQHSQAIVQAAQQTLSEQQKFTARFEDWTALLDTRLDELESAVLTGIETLRSDMHQRFDALSADMQRLLQLLGDGGLAERFQPQFELNHYSADYLQRVRNNAQQAARSPRYRSRASILLATAQAASGDNSEAERNLLAALESAENDADRALAQYNLFHVYLQRGSDSYPQALSALKTATDLQRQDYALWDENNYQVERILGAGGMGCVFLARRTLGGQAVALKTLWDDDSEAQDRFRREAQTLADIAGAYVPAANYFGYGDPHNQRRLFVEMDYVPDAIDGEAWLTQHGLLSAEQGIQLGLHIAQGLVLAHEQGICHHDLKPANLLLSQHESGLTAKIIDFGLASSVLNLQRQHGQSRLSDKSVMAQQVFGSFDYAPPEQLGDERYGPPGPRSDLYSFGKTLYRLLTGQSAAHPSFRALKSEPALQELLFECLEPDPQSRPASAAELLERLQALATPPSTLPNKLPNLHGSSADTVQTLQRQTADKLNLNIMFRDRLKEGGTGPEMMVIPAGQFLMGSPQDEADRNRDERPHEVTIEQPFALAKYACTFEEYDFFCTVTDKNKPSDYGWGRGRRPVIDVSWHDAMAYCEWLSEQTGHEYRLPSEAEWEYACRAGTTTPFYFGETISTEQANYNGDYTYGSGQKGDYLKKTVEVGQYPANAWGLHDMHGNVWEWTGSEYEEDYHGAKQRLLDKSGRRSVLNRLWYLLDKSTEADSPSVLRGGSWDSKPWDLRSARRSGSPADVRSYYGGSRPSRSTTL